MINRIKGITEARDIGTVLPRNINTQELLDMLTEGIYVNESSNPTGSECPRVIFKYGGELYVRAIRDTLTYVLAIPNNLRDASRVCFSDLSDIVRYHRDHEYTLSVLAYSKSYTHALKTQASTLKDFK